MLSVMKATGKITRDILSTSTAISFPVNVVMY